MEWVDMLKAGIIDPAKLQGRHSRSCIYASLLLTTECIVTDLPEKDAPPAGAPGMGGWEVWAA
jgi:chaperonin GroEL